MSGIYIHIPYCRQACHYCDFHFSTNLKNKTAMVEAIVRELGLRRNYFKELPILDADRKAKTPINTLYFGGGTPSLLSEEQLNIILEAVYAFFDLSNLSEQTIECNPEDLSSDKLRVLKSLGFNRLSIGIQTFQDPILKYINRAHTAEHANFSVKTAKEIGFDNITIDLIYALPQSTINTLLSDLEKVIRLDVQHISAYCFTIEEKTVFGHWLRQEKISSRNDVVEESHYRVLTSVLAKNGYEQYEISNFARDGRYSKHNSAYWLGKHYLGIGPGAHSYNGCQREWNVSNNSTYLEMLEQNKLASEVEVLTEKDKLNEILLTRMRTKWGVDLSNLKEVHHWDLLIEKTKEVNMFVQRGWVKQEGNLLFLTDEGKLFGDKVVGELMR